MPDDTINTQTSTLPEDGPELWQIEAGPPSYEEIYHNPTTSRHEAMSRVFGPPYRVRTQQERAEMATLTNIRIHTSRLTQQLDDHILRCQSRNRSDLSEAATGSNAEAANGIPCQDEASIIEAAERDRLVELTLVIHDMLNSLQSHPSGPVDHTTSFLPHETQEDQRDMQATRYPELSQQDADRILAQMGDSYSGTADRGDEEPHGRSRRRQRLGRHALSQRIARWSGV